MTNLIRAEFRKLRSTRSWMLLLVLALVYCLAITVAFTLLGSRGKDTPDLTTAAGLSSVYSWVSQAYVFTLILGVLGITTEYRHKTITATLLAVPRRGRMIVAKLLTYLIVGFGFAVVIVGVTFGAAALILTVRGFSPTAPGLDLPQIILGGLLTITLYAVMGVGLGVLIRNQIAAIVGALIYIWWIESLVVVLLPGVGKWLPGGAAQAMLNMDFGAASGGQIGGDLLSWWGGCVVFLGYTAVLTVLGSRLTVRRDVT